MAELMNDINLYIQIKSNQMAIMEGSGNYWMAERRVRTVQEV